MTIINELTLSVKLWIICLENLVTIRMSEIFLRVACYGQTLKFVVWKSRQRWLQALSKEATKGYLFTWARPSAPSALWFLFIKIFIAPFSLIMLWGSPYSISSSVVVELVNRSFEELENDRLCDLTKKQTKLYHVHFIENVLKMS